MSRSKILLLALALLLSRAIAQECQMRLDESDIDLHGWLRAFYSCKALGRSFVMDHNVQRPLPSYASFAYGRRNYHEVLREVLGPLGLRLVQGKWMDAVVVAPAREPKAPPTPPTPLAGVPGDGGREAPEASAASASDSVPVLDAPKARRLRAKASGLLRGSARKMGFEWGDVLGNASGFASAGIRSGGHAAASAGSFFDVALIASDSLGSLDFARVVDFYAHDTARVIFGSEVRRAESSITYETGSTMTQYSSLFDGLTVTLVGDRWAFVWRGQNSVLEVPGSVGGCASGTSKIEHESTVGVPFLSRVPVLRWLFSAESRYSDDLLVEVCVELVPEREQEEELEDFDFGELHIEENDDA